LIKNFRRFTKNQIKMFRLKFSIALLFLSFISVFSQENINDYKYIIVPVQYEFQKGEDAYQVNSLTKFLFEKEGFEVYLSSELPESLILNRCLALTARVNNHSKMLSTKMNIDLVDCRSNVVYASTEGKSKEKEYKKAYHESIREAFEDIKALEYKYNGGSKEEVALIPLETDVVKDETEALKTVQESNSSLEKVAPAAIAATAVVATNNSKPEIVNVVAEISTEDRVLYAQPTADGFQLVDSTPKVIYILNKTNIADVYLIKGHDGIVYKKGDVWSVDAYIDGKLVTKELSLKFF